ncbi:hypothetical protein D7Z54_17115 [Salibacterium salarium]|uniref:Uncharacterized protein n=1 Tax=Salibacterium salarium TaxID=284579 RepID=A0A428N116_9BACI|nr:hypothetical protein [Salibacterium salarium]RSL32145.1 hypothetical protein D7Z54_17115 [Salibacterium salarium]
MEKQLNAILDSLETLKQGQDRFETKLNRFETKLSQLDERQDRFETTLEQMDEKLDHFALETRRHFKHIENILDEHKETFNVAADKIKTTHIDMEYLSGKAGQHDTRLHSLERQLQSL